MGPISGVSNIYEKQNLPRHAKTGQGDLRRGGDRNQWCTLHTSTTHSKADLLPYSAWCQQ